MIFQKNSTNFENEEKMCLMKDRMMLARPIKSYCTFNLWLVLLSLFLLLGEVQNVPTADGYALSAKRAGDKMAMMALIDKIVRTASDMSRPRYGRSFEDFKLLPSYQYWKKYQINMPNKGYEDDNE